MSWKSVWRTFKSRAGARSIGGRPPGFGREISEHISLESYRLLDHALEEGRFLEVYAAWKHVRSSGNASHQHAKHRGGNWDDLHKLLKELGIDETNLVELRGTLQHDKKLDSRGVKDWISRNAAKVFDHGLQVATTLGTTILTQLIKRHLGLQVCQFFCVNGRGLFLVLGMGARGKGQRLFPRPAM